LIAEFHSVKKAHQTACWCQGNSF